MKKRLLKIILLPSIISIGISSCQKEFNERNGGNTPESNTRGARGPRTNRPPVANAGADQLITLPTTTVSLYGSASDPDNNITGYQWTKISGPSSFTIANPNSVQTQVTNLVEGAYQFELKVTDKFGLYDKDMVQVTVWGPFQASPPPCTTCRIVFVSARDGNNGIYTSNTDGSNITRLTNDPGYDDQPAWSPDGARIAFTRNGDLFIMNADGSNVVQTTFSGGCWWGLTWSPDGTKIAYSDYTNSGMGIYVINATGGTPMLLFEGGEVIQPAWSPDGTKIALVADRYVTREEYTYDIFIINADGTGFTPLTSGINSGYDSFTSPSWSPGGTQLAVAFSGRNGSYIGVINSNGTGFTLLRPGGGSTSWSADGTIIVYTSYSGSENNVSWVAADGSAGGTIVTNGWDADWQH